MVEVNHESNDNEPQAPQKPSLVQRLMTRNKPQPGKNGGDGLAPDERALRASEIEAMLGIPPGYRRNAPATNAQIKALNHVVNPPKDKLGEVAILTPRQASLFAVAEMINAIVDGYEGNLLSYTLNKYYELSRAVDGAMFVSSFRQAAIQAEEDMVRKQMNSPPIGGF